MHISTDKYIMRDNLMELISKSRNHTFTAESDDELGKELSNLASEVLVSKNGHYPTVYLFLDIEGHDYILSGTSVMGEAITVKDCFDRTCGEYAEKNNLTLCQRFVLEHINTRKYTTPNWDKAFVLNEYGLAGHEGYTVAFRNIWAKP